MDAKGKKIKTIRINHQCHVQYNATQDSLRSGSWSAQMSAYCYKVLCPVQGHGIQRMRRRGLYEKMFY